MLNERSKLVLLSLLKTEEPMQISDFSQMYKVSNRTIRYDLDNIDYWLKHNGLPQLLRKPNCGIQFCRDIEARQKAFNGLGNVDFRYCVLSQEERINAIIMELLQRKGFVTIDQLAELIAVSRSTVINDFAEVRKRLTKYDLQLTPQRRYGMRIVGNEVALRRCVVDCLNQHLSFDKALEQIRHSVKCNGLANPAEACLVEQLDLAFIEESVKKIETRLETVFADLAFSNLVLHVTLAIARLQLGRNIIMPKAEFDKIKGYSQYVVIKNVVGEMSKKLGVAIPDDEVGYITQHVLASSIYSAKTSEIPIDLQMLVCKLISAVSNRLGFDLSSDQQLFDGLSNHMGPALQRCQQGFQINNPDLAELKIRQKDLYDIVAGCTEALLADKTHVITEAEIGFLTMHFGAALERRQLNKALPNVLVVCGTGLGTANLLAARLRANFNLSILDTLAAHQVAAVLQTKKVDLIITTIPLEITAARTVQVSPLLTFRDMEKLRSLLGEKVYPSLNMSDIIAIIHKHCQVFDSSQLTRELSCYFSNIGVPVKAEDHDPVLHLHDVITQRHIKLDETVADWEEAVLLGGTILCDSGAVEPQYVEDMVATIKKLGPYVVIAPGVAIPHAANNVGVNKVAMSFARLKRPVCFGKPENDPVDLLFCFATPDKVSHQQILYELGRLLGDETAVARLRAEADIADVRAVFAEYVF